MKKQISTLERVALVLPVLMMPAQAIACGDHYLTYPSYLQAAAVTLITASVLVGTPMLAFSLIHFLSGNTGAGVQRMCTFIGAIGVCIASMLMLEIH